jgi:hypothetical protein
MELEKLEKRRKEIIEMNRVTAENGNKLIEEFKRIKTEYESKVKYLNDNYFNVLDQLKINNGALSEVNQWIEAIKKNETEIEDTDNAVDKKGKKSKK